MEQKKRSKKGKKQQKSPFLARFRIVCATLPKFSTLPQHNAKKAKKYKFILFLKYDQNPKIQVWELVGLLFEVENLHKMRYSKELKETAFGYYMKGLNSKEIGKLLELNFRTVQEFMRVDEWKARRTAENAKNEKRIIRKYLRAQNGKTAK